MLGRNRASDGVPAPFRKEVTILHASNLEDHITEAVNTAGYSGPCNDTGNNGYVAIKVMLLTPIDHAFLAALKRLIARGEPVGRLSERDREWVLPAHWNGLRCKYQAAIKVCAFLVPRGIHLSIIRRAADREPFKSKEAPREALAIVPPDSYGG